VKTAEHVAATTALERLFRPRAIAIIGASEDFSKINGRPLKFLLDKGYPGRIFPVNPKYATLAGLPCYPSVAAIPEPVDLAIVAVPARAVPDAVADCVARQVAAAVVFSSGFGEMGDEGRRLEAQVVEAARRGGLRLLGPNTVGFMNTFDHVMATFSQAGDGPTPPGPAAFLTQSGAFGTAMVGLGRRHGLAFGYFVNSGNEADLTFAELLGWIVDDPQVRVLAGYIEGLRDGRRLLAVADRALEAGKPLVIAKVGRSAAGARAAVSHTGALAGQDRVYADVFRQKGILRPRDEEGLLDLVSAFALAPLPAGPGLGLVTHSGGAGVLMADRAEELGLAVPELHAETQAALRQVVPAFGAVRNPVDITAQFIAEPALLRAALETVLADPGIDAAIFYLGLMERHADQVVANLRAVREQTAKPLLVAWVAAPEAAQVALRASGICVLPTATRAVDAVHGLAQFAAARRRRLARAADPASPPTAAGAIERARRTAEATGSTILGTPQAFELLAAYGVRVPRARLVTSPDEAAAAVEALGGPAALKIESPAIAHKTEADAIRLGVRDAAGARRAFEEIVTSARRHAPAAPIHGVLVQEMVPGGVEVALGFHRDAQFGPVVMVGLGGVLVEVLQDVAFGAAPLTRDEAEEMVRGLRGVRALAAFRGRPPADQDALVDALLAVSRLAADGEDTLAELDVNPLLVLPRGRGAIAVDALVGVRLSDGGCSEVKA
jgi:acetyltransferase